MLLVQKGKEIGISVEQDVSKYLADIQLQAKIPDPEKFQQYIREQSGQSFEDFKSEIRNGYLTQRVIRQEVGGRLTVPRAELEKYYNENKSKYMREDRVFLREILVSTEGKDAAGIAAAEKKARDLSARAKKGEKFPEMARANSDSTTKENMANWVGSSRRNSIKPFADILSPVGPRLRHGSDSHRERLSHLEGRGEAQSRPGLV